MYMYMYMYMYIYSRLFSRGEIFHKCLMVPLLELGNIMILSYVVIFASGVVLKLQYRI